MVSGKRKKRKPLKAEFKQIAIQKGKKSPEKQGKGAGRRKSFTLPAKWREEHSNRGSKTQLKFVSPGKTVYKTEKSVAETLVARNLEACFNASSASSKESQHSEYEPDFDEPGCSGELKCSDGKKKKEKSQVVYGT